MDWRYKVNNIEALKARVTNNKEKLVELAAVSMANYVRSRWSGFYPPHSMPGQSPAIITGNLDESIGIEQIGEATYRVYQDADQAPYGIFLETGTEFIAPRPFWTPSVLYTQEAFPDLCIDAGLFNR